MDEGTVLRSPNELMEAARDVMLAGKEPVSRVEWALVVNFWCVNIIEEVQPAAIKLMAMIYNCPLEDEDIEYIVEKRKEKNDETVL